MGAFSCAVSHAYLHRVICSPAAASTPITRPCSSSAATTASAAARVLHCILAHVARQPVETQSHAVFICYINTNAAPISVIQVSSVHFSNTDGLAPAAGINEGWLNRHGSLQSHNSNRIQLTASQAINHRFNRRWRRHCQRNVRQDEYQKRWP